jgi:hypothetical protein
VDSRDWTNDKWERNRLGSQFADRPPTVTSFSRPFVLFLLALLIAFPAQAQNWSFDARQIALGSREGGGTLAADMMAEANGYRAMVLPFGLVQVLGDAGALNPSSDDFDFVRAREDLASPIHYTFGRHATSTGKDFVVDLRNASLNRDLNLYRGFVPVNQPPAEGLAAPVWGHTVKLRQNENGSFHGVYIGAGPYVSMQSDLAVDDQLIDILDSASPTALPNAQIRSSTQVRAQMAAAIAVGYRGRFTVPQASSARDGVYVAVNYNVLRGIRYEDVDVALRLDTDPLGLLTVNTQLPAPLSVARDHSTSGWGRAVDIGLGTVVNRWEVAFGANGLGNRIDWTHVSSASYTLANPLTGRAEFDEHIQQLSGVRRVSVPIAYSTSLGYTADVWTAVGDVGWGLGGRSLHGGYEYRLKKIALRGGGIYARQLWSPTAGIGLNLSAHTALDLAIYGNAANAERKRHPAVAVSVRFGGRSETDAGNLQLRN